MILKVENLSLGYRNKQIFENYTLTLAPGEICAILGPSGCGKTSLLNILAGNITHYTGQVSLGGAPINYRQQNIGFVAQDYGLLPWLTVYQNVILPLKIKGLPIGPYADKIAYLFDRLAIGPLRNSYPLRLSGGERQRVSIAAAFLLDLDLLLLDEPFSALDQITREETQDLFLQVWSELKPSTVFVTHSIDEAVFLGQKIILLSKSPANVIEEIVLDKNSQGDIRSSDGYLEACKKIRTIMKREWGPQ